MISYEQYLDYSPYFAQVDIEAPSTRAEFLELFNKIPQQAKDFMVSMETAEHIFNLGTSLKLDAYDTEAIAYIIRQIMTGEISLAKATEVVVREIKVSPEDARKILGSCFRDVLTPVVEDIKKIQTLRFPNTSTLPEKQSTANPPRTPTPSSVINPSNIVDLRAK